MAHESSDQSDSSTDGGISGKRTRSEVDRKESKGKRRHGIENDSDDSLSDSEDDARHRRRRKSRKQRSKSSKRHRSRHSKERKGKKVKRSSASLKSSASSDSDSLTENRCDDQVRHSRKKTTEVVNKRLLAKLAARGETLDERKARRAERRAARIQATLGYTADDNPFNDPNLHETFTWKKRDAKMAKSNAIQDSNVETNKNVLSEIEKVRKRRKDRELQFEEMERIRAEEARMKELENYDEWARKEEEFHLQQQRQRSAIRLVEGREKPIDVLAKNILLFGLSEQEKEKRSAVKYQEKYNVLDAMEDLEAELEEPQSLLKMLKLNELEELLLDVLAFQKLEREALSVVPGHARNETTGNSDVMIKYWDNLRIVAEDEIQFLKSGGIKGSHAVMIEDIRKILEGNQSIADFENMKDEIDTKLRTYANDANSFGGDFDREYWIFVRDQLLVHIAKLELSDLHSKMLVRQLEKLETRKDELTAISATENDVADRKQSSRNEEYNYDNKMDLDMQLGDLEEELGLASEYDLNMQGALQNYSWQDKHRPRKPRYFNRVKTGYDWNKYNQTHYDKDNPPPKSVQGYKFNIFYPDLIDQTKTPQFRLEPSNADGFCIIRFTAGPPYEDIAFKIVNREWNRSRKRGFKCTFERGVLSLYFNFTTPWYRK